MVKQMIIGLSGQAHRMLRFTGRLKLQQTTARRLECWCRILEVESCIHCKLHFQPLRVGGNLVLFRSWTWHKTSTRCSWLHEKHRSKDGGNQLLHMQLRRWLQQTCHRKSLEHRLQMPNQNAWQSFQIVQSSCLRIPFQLLEGFLVFLAFHGSKLPSVISIRATWY